MPAGPRAIVFDCDGVIADDEPLHLDAFRRALAPEGFLLALDRLREEVGWERLAALF